MPKQRRPDSIKSIQVGILLSFTEVSDVVWLESKSLIAPVVPFNIGDIRVEAGVVSADAHPLRFL